MKNSPDIPKSSPSDTSLRFLFEEADVRGETVHLDHAYGDILAIHQYPPGVSRLLGEFLAAAVLLSTNLKFEGRLTLQVRSQGQIPLLMAECDHTLHVRGIARGAEHATANRNDLLLADGQLAITVEPDNGQRYQGIVPLVKDSLAHSLDAYFQQSEQLQTRIWLAADGHRAAGFLLQQLPPQITATEAIRLQQWEHLSTLASTLTDDELLVMNTADLLYRRYHEEPVRLFEPNPVSFHCSCSRERTFSALASLGAADVEELLQELGYITMDCEFCNQQYRFTTADLGPVLAKGESKILH
jgi:molecular chaperone Hsp33